MLAPVAPPRAHVGSRPPREGERERAARPAGLSDRERILATVDAIPRGRVATYGQVASEAGLPRRARRVGRVLAELEPGSSIPWHRVVAASGRVAARDLRGVREQKRRLAAEGVAFRGGRVDLARHRWAGVAVRVGSGE
jgi:methylated-DNA-protein-cysteine methyltransferase-like protein